MKSADITCSTYKKRVFSQWFKFEYINISNIEEPLLIINLPYTTDHFYNLESKKRKKLAEKLLKTLQKNEIYCLYYSGITDCSEFSELKNHFTIPNGKTILKEYAVYGALKLTQQLKLDKETAKIAIYQKKFNHNGFKILCDFAQHFKNITIIGENSDKLEEYSNDLLNVYGLSIDIQNDITFNKSYNFLFLLDKVSDLCTDEKTIIIDIAGEYQFYCLNSLRFKMPSSLNKLLPYFTQFDDKFAEFLLYLSNNGDSLNGDISVTLNNLGAFFNGFCAKSKIMLDK